MSSDLTWLITRSNSSFLVKRNGLRLSSEPGNLYNLHSLKYSGLAPSRTVAMTAAPSGKGIQVTTRKTKLAPSKIAKSKQVTVIAKPARTTAKSVRGLVQGYRPDLVKAAVARAGRLLASQVPPKAPKAKKVRGAKKI